MKCLDVAGWEGDKKGYLRVGVPDNAIRAQLYEIMPSPQKTNQQSLIGKGWDQVNEWVRESL